VEIRRIEGILPVEGVSRDLPLRLENFSRKDMEKLLSLIAKGESKGNLGSEFEALLKATFLEYVGEGRGRIKVGDAVIDAEILAERIFEPGENLLLKVKSVSDRIELSVVSPIREKLSKILREKLREILKGNVDLKLLTEEEMSAVLKILEEKYPELVPGFKAFSLKASPFSPYFLLSLLLLAKDDNLKLKTSKSKEELLRQIENLLSLYSLFVLSGIVALPVYLEGGFEGSVFYLKGDVSRAFLKVDAKKGKFRALLSLVGRKVSLEYSVEGDFEGRVTDEGLRDCLLRVGLEPVLVRRIELRSDEEVLLSWMKDKGISMDIVT